MDDFLDSVKPILFSAIIILFLWSVPDLFDTIVIQSRSAKW